MAVRQGMPGSLAARVTYLLEPKNWLIVTVVGVGAHADGLAGAAWGLLAAFFAAVLPTVFISYGIRRGRWEDRNVGTRRARLVVLGFITASVATGLILLAVLGAPALLTGYLAFMLASVAALAAITLVWKISIHCAVAAGSVTILALVYGPLVLGGYLLVGLLGWARVAVRDHTVPQVVAGSVLGAMAAFAAYAAIVALAGGGGERGRIGGPATTAWPAPWSPRGRAQAHGRGRRPPATETADRWTPCSGNGALVTRRHRQARRAGFHPGRGTLARSRCV